MTLTLPSLNKLSSIFWVVCGLLLIYSGLKVYTDARGISSDVGEIDSIARVESLTNFVKVKKNSEFLWNNANIGQKISRNTILFADQNSQAVITYKDGSKLILLPGSIIEIMTKENEKFDFVLKKGKVLSVPKPSVLGPPEVLVVSKEEAISDPSLIYVVRTKPHEKITSVDEKSFQVHWQWTNGINSKGKIRLQYTDPSGEIHSINQKADSNAGQVKLAQSGLYHWFLYLDNELMSGGEIEFQKLHSPLMKAPQGTILSLSGNVKFEWYSNMKVETNELQFLSGADSESVIIDGTNSSYIKKLALSKAYQWRIRSTTDGVVGPWSKYMAFSVDPNDPRLFDKYKPFLSQIQTVITLQDLPHALDLDLNLAKEFKLFLDGGEVDPSKVQFKKPGVYVLEIRHESSTGSISKKIEVKLLPLEDKIVVPENQEIKI